MTIRLAILAAAFTTALASAAAQDSSAVRVRGDSAQFRLVDADVRAVIRAVAPYLSKPIFAADLPAVRLTLDTPSPVPTERIPALFRALIEAAGLTLKEDSVSYQVGTAAAAATTTPPQASIERSLHVLPLRHARAAEVASTINALYGGDIAAVSSRRLSSGTLGDELIRTRMPQQGERVAPDASAPISVGGPLTLVPDERTNSLLVRASELDLQLIQQAVAQLDTRPLQVLIEVLIVEARKDRTFDLATAGSVSRETPGKRESAELSSANPGSLVLQFMKLSRADVTLRVSAAASRGDARIVSRPVLVVTNNAEARFLVGSQRPFVQVSRSLPTDAAVRDQVVQYRDVGTKLVVRPSINADGYVALLVQQEMSTATDETQFGAPIISTREAMTEVLVRDGQTIVIGGLTDSNRSAAQAGIPLLSAIPLLGGLFGEARRRDAETEIFLFLTPHVIRTDEDADSLTAPRLPSTEKGKEP